MSETKEQEKQRKDAFRHKVREEVTRIIQKEIIRDLIKSELINYTKVTDLENEALIFPGKMNVNQWVRKVEDSLKEIRTAQNPFHLESLLREAQNSLYGLQNRFGELLVEVQDIKRNRMLRLYTNGEIKDMFSASGLLLKNVADHFHVSEPAASRYINGDIQDLVVRDQLFEYFKKVYMERREKEKSEKENASGKI